MQTFWTLIWEHWILSTIALFVGVPLLIAMIRNWRTKAFVASTLRDLYPEGLPQPAAGQHRQDVKFLGDKIRSREAKFFNAFVKAILSPLVDRQIIVRRGAPKSDHDYGKFSIFLGYGPQGGKVASAARKLFGWERAYDGKTYAYSGTGVPIMDESGDIVAEYSGHTVYFFVDPNLYGTFGCARIFAEVLKRVAQEIPHAGGEEDSGKFADALEAAVKRSLSERSPRRKREDNDPEKELEDPAVTWQKMVDTARESEAESVRLRQQAAHELGSEYDALCRVKKIESIVINEKDLEIHTETLYLTDPATGNVYEMGRFQITIPYSNSRSVVWKNKTRQVDGVLSKMMHLHVSSNGRACLGNTGPWFNKLILELRFADAAQLAIAFIETVNPEDTRTYKYIGNWPRVS